ncbi:MAG TPA: DUF3107 domain-containing protein [Acidimicrobiia bacterium]|jgi:Protein of unknown function (DUF3107)|nr:DUF3107 domain-containing protein [Acidimicrobiia bacterium]
MEVKIGVVYTAKELTVDLDGSADELKASIQDALKNGSPVLWLEDARGRHVGVPADKVAYVEIADEEATQKVGFGRS